MDPETGAVILSQQLDRNAVSSITYGVKITDTSAEPPQDGPGNLVITIIDVNDFAPEFPAPWSPESQFLSIDVKEETPVGSLVHRFTATDKDSNIARFEIVPANNPYFEIEKASGRLTVKQLLDFEELEEPKRLTFDLRVFDAGIPEKSAAAVVVVNIVNVNDEAPVFDQQMYVATVAENVALGTPIVTVSARDLDEGEFGRVSYRLEGTHAEDFAIDPEDGTISVVNTGLLDREQLETLILQVVAADSAPPESRKSATVPVNITLTDVNDNPPAFVQKEYRATIVDNIPFFPEASPIVQVTATDSDADANGRLAYSLVRGNTEALFRMDNMTGVLYPNASFIGHRGEEFELVVQVNDENGQGPWTTLDECNIRVLVESVNSHKPRWDPPPPLNETVTVVEESDILGAVFKTVFAVDQDGSDTDNGRVSYFFKVRNENVLETPEFRIDMTTGELRTKVRLDHEERDHYELVIVAKDHGSPVAFETLRFLNIIVEDIDDNIPTFLASGAGKSRSSIAVGGAPGSIASAKFTVPEEEEPGYLVGKVDAVDPDEGKHGRVFYYILRGNEGSWFSIDKTQGTLYTRRKLDREERDAYRLLVKASNQADYVCEARTCDIPYNEAEDGQDGSVMAIDISIQDINDNIIQFRSEKFFVGIPFDASVGDLILDAGAVDPDLEANGRILYSIKSSNLFRQGETTSAGSIVPSPFRMTDTGRLVLDTLMAEFNQQR